MNFALKKFCNKNYIWVSIVMYMKTKSSYYANVDNIGIKEWFCTFINGENNLNYCHYNNIGGGHSD